MSIHGQHEADEGNLERWLITYADMITLLMAFFVMMYAMSVVDLEKFQALAQAMGHAFGAAAAEAGTRGASAGTLAGGEGLLPGDAPAVGNRASLANAIRSGITRDLPRRLRDRVEVVHCGGAVTVRLKADAVTFPAGQAALTADARRILDAIGPALTLAQGQVRVEGHTCNLPISTAQFPSNWELSAQRAANVMAYLVRCSGMSPEGISAVGFAASRPLVANTDEAARRRNRRVDIVILTGDPLEPAVAGGPPPAAPQPWPPGIAPQPVRLCPPVNLQAGQRMRSGADSDTASHLPRGD
ncbi:MAG: flagellar motor protein MotB [Armatimonadota bacterium]